MSASFSLVLPTKLCGASFGTFVWIQEPLGSVHKYIISLSKNYDDENLNLNMKSKFNLHKSIDQFKFQL